MASHLLCIEFLNLHKPREVFERPNPFDELSDEKFRERFRLTKKTTLRLLSEVSCKFYYTTVRRLYYSVLYSCISWKLQVLLHEIVESDSQNGHELHYAYRPWTSASRIR